MAKYDDVNVRLVGEDGNIFAIVGRVSRALRRAGVGAEEIRAFQGQITASDSYNEALQVVMAWVHVEDEDEE